jgi:DsbE subfamily thiol:disulfide oxidoreductase
MQSQLNRYDWGMTMRVNGMLIIYMTVFIMFLAGCSFGGGTVSQTPALQEEVQIVVGTQVGQKAPDFSLLDEKDEKVSLAQFAGKVVVLNFWATWCGPCRAEMPELQRFHQQKDTDVILLGIDIKEDKDTILQFMKRAGYSYPVVRDTFAQASDTYQIRAIPTTYVLDKQGIIRYKKVGPVTAAELKKISDSLK